MYTCRVEAGFSAVHQLALADGSVEPLHGHDWKVQTVFAGPNLDASGMLVDFVAAQTALTQLLQQFHHRQLNGLPLMGGLNPTAENVARVIFERLQQALPGAPLTAVYVEESPGCVAGFASGSHGTPAPPWIS